MAMKNIADLQLPRLKCRPSGIGPRSTSLQPRSNRMQPERQLGGNKNGEHRQDH